MEPKPEPDEFLHNLLYCNKARFISGTAMLANRTIGEFAVFVSAAIFSKESDEYKWLKNLEEKENIFGQKIDHETGEEFILWSRLFKRWYEKNE